jgi:hypothetical protein
VLNHVEELDFAFFKPRSSPSIPLVTALIRQIVTDCQRDGSVQAIPKLRKLTIRAKSEIKNRGYGMNLLSELDACAAAIKALPVHTRRILQLWIQLDLEGDEYSQVEMVTTEVVRDMFLDVGGPEALHVSCGMITKP